MTHYMHQGVRYSVAPTGALDITELLPLGTYKVGWIEQIDDYYLEKIDDFEVTGKIYGKATAQRDRILNTFDSRPSGTGVMLSGEKGSGKTLLAKLLSLQGQEKGIPTIVINQPWRGESFNAFIQSIEQPAIIVFDEFEKVYDEKQQEQLLTLLDGTYPSKKLFILTCNDRYRVNTHMRNRPGRIFYRLDFGGLDADFIRTYCIDELTNAAHIEDVVRVSMLFARFNFDILKALVEEMNRYEEGAEQALEMLNAKPELGDKLTYTVSLMVNGQPVPKEKVHGSGEWRGNPLMDEVVVYYQGTRPKGRKAQSENPFFAALATAQPAELIEEDEEDEMVSLRFNPSQLTRVDAKNGDFVFDNEQGVEATLTEKVRKYTNYDVVY